jgi:hypothetical protein
MFIIKNLSWLLLSFFLSILDAFVMSVRPRGITRLTLDVFSLNLMFEYFSKICREISSFIKI